MSKLPYWPFEIEAYKADTVGLNTTQHGAYILLLMALWESPEGRILADLGILAHYVRSDNPGAFIGRTWPKIAHYFETTTDDAGRAWLTQKRVGKDRARIETKLTARAMAGRVGGLASAVARGLRGVNLRKSAGGAATSTAGWQASVFAVANANRTNRLTDKGLVERSASALLGQQPKQSSSNRQANATHEGLKERSLLASTSAPGSGGFARRLERGSPPLPSVTADRSGGREPQELGEILASLGRSLGYVDGAADSELWHEAIAVNGSQVPEPEPATLEIPTEPNPGASRPGNGGGDGEVAARSSPQPAVSPAALAEAGRRHGAEAVPSLLAQWQAWQSSQPPARHPDASFLGWCRMNHATSPQAPI